MEGSRLALSRTVTQKNRRRSCFNESRNRASRIWRLL